MPIAVDLGHKATKQTNSEWRQMQAFTTLFIFVEHMSPSQQEHYRIYAMKMLFCLIRNTSDLKTMEDI